MTSFRFRVFAVALGFALALGLVALSVMVGDTVTQDRAALPVVNAQDSAAPEVISATLTTSNPDGATVVPGDTLTLTLQTNEEVTPTMSIAGNAVPFTRVATPVGRVSDGDGGAVLGSPTSVFVQGDYAYITAARALEIVDVSDPASPRHAGKLAIRGSSKVHVQGNYAYVISWKFSTLTIVDVSDPANPRQVGRLSHGDGGAVLLEPTAVFVLGNHAYITSLANAMSIVDVSDPASPRQVGRLTHGDGGAVLETPVSVFVRGSHAYVAGWESYSLAVVDVSDPANPRQVGLFLSEDGTRTPPIILSVFVRGHHAYLGTNYGLYIVDVSVPANPVQVGHMSGFQYDSILVQGSYAYFASRHGKFLSFIDVSDPANPRFAGNVFDDDRGGRGPLSAFVRGGHAYVTLNRSNFSENSDTLEVIALGNTYTATFAARAFHPTGSVDDFSYSATLTDTAGNERVFSREGATINSSNYLRVATTSNNPNPGWAREGDTVTATIQLTDQVEAITAPVVTINGRAISTQPGPGNPSPGKPSDAATFAFTVDANTPQGEVGVLHGSLPHTEPFARVVVDRAAPEAISATLTTSNPDGATVAEGDALTLTLTTSEEVTPTIRIASNAVPFTRAVSRAGGMMLREGIPQIDEHDHHHHDEPWGPMAVFVEGGHAYVASTAGLGNAPPNTLDIVDVSDPAAPRFVGRVGLDWPRAVFVRGRHAYLGTNYGLYIVDVSDPASPRRVGALADGDGGVALGVIRSVFVRGNYAYVGTLHALEVVDVSDPASPRRVGGIANGDAALDEIRSVFVSGDHAYIVAEKSFALEVVRLENTYTATIDVGASPPVSTLDEVTYSVTLTDAAGNTTRLLSPHNKR